MATINKSNITPANIEGLLYGFFVKHDKLDEIIKREFVGTPEEAATEMNVIIDIPSMYATLIQKSNFIANINDISLTAIVLNTVSHYRSWLNKIGVKSKVYLVYAMNNPWAAQCTEKTNKIILGGCTIKKKQSDILTTQWLGRNKKLVRAIAQYLPEVYYVNTYLSYTGFARDVIYDLLVYLGENGNMNPNLIVTKDPMTYSLVGHYPFRGKFGRTTVLRPKKSMQNGGEDCSYIVNRDNLLRTPIFERRNSVVDESYTDIDKICSKMCPELYPLVMSIMGMDVHGFSSIKGLQKREALKLLDIYFETYPNKYYRENLMGFLDSVDNFTFPYKQRSMSTVEFLGLARLVELLDPLYGHRIAAERSTEQFRLTRPDLSCGAKLDGTITSLPTQLYDPLKVQDINNKFFTATPIDLNGMEY